MIRDSVHRISGNGEVVIGRRLGDQYASAFVDEIKMYNRQLSQEEIINMYWTYDKTVPEKKRQFLKMSNSSEMLVCGRKDNQWWTRITIKGINKYYYYVPIHKAFDAQYKNSRAASGCVGFVCE